MTDYSRSNILLPHFEEAEAFLNALDGKDAPYTFQTFDDVEVWSDEKQKTIKRMDKSLVRVYHGTFNEHKQKLASINKRGGGVFVTINETDLKGRKKENILKVRAVFVDLDGSPIQPILDLPEDLQPHIIIESSPNRWHAYWLVDNCTLEQFPHVQRALAAKFNGDISVNNIDRVMRLAGFSHNKGESFITHIHTMQDKLYPYSVNKLIVGLGLTQEPIPDKPTPDRYSPNNTYNSIDDDFTIGLPPTADVITDLKNALEYLSCEERPDWIRQGMHLKTLGNAGLELWLTWSSKSAKFDRADAIHTWEGLEANRTDYKAIFNEAKANGWTNPLSSHKPPKTAKADPIDPDLINKTIEALPTPEERNTARALQDALTYIEPQDAIGESLSTGEKVIGYGLSHEYKQAQGSIGALLAIDWDKRTGGNSFSFYRSADLKHDDPIKAASIYKLAQSKGWVMPANQDNTIETHRNAPRGNDAMLYGIFGDFGRIAAKNTEVNPYAAAFNSMIYLSSAIGRDVFFYVGNDIHHVRLFGLHIGRSSKGQKGGAHSLLNRVIKHLTEREPTLAPRKHTGGLSSREGLAALLHDGYMDGKQEVEPITDKRLFIRESEFANVMHQASRNGNTLSAALRDGWDGVGIQPATKHRGIWSTNPHIAIAAACTPVELITLTTKNDVSNGFLNRFVIFWAERTKLVPFPESTPQHIVDDLAQRLSNIIDFAKGDYHWDTNPSLSVENTRQITLSDEAKKVYGHIYIKVFPKLNDGEKVTALTERKAPYLLRIAALFALSDFSLVIEAHHINAAYEWIKYWHESVKFIFNDEAEEVQNTQIASNAEKILDYLKSKGSKHKATQTELSENVFNKHASSKEINAAISSLLSTTPPQIEVLTGERADGSNGRKPKLYTLFSNSQNPCEISEISEITTAATNNPKFAKSEISEISEISPLNSQTYDSLNSEITLNSQTSQTSQSVRNNENPTASSNFAKFANFADTCEDREVF